MKNFNNEQIAHVVKNELQYIQFKKLLEYEDIITHCFTLRDLDFGIRSIENKNIEKIYLNNKIICEELGLDYRNIVKPCQSHSSEVKRIDQKINKEIPDMYMEQYNNTDGLVTNKKDIILATVNADCMLLLFFDPIKKVIANSHSGWRGTLDRIAVKTINKMVSEYGSNPKNIICCITPSIRACHFEVDKEIKDLFEEKNEYRKEMNEIFKRGKMVNNKQKYHIDLVLMNQILLLEAGLKKENIIDSGLCTVCESEHMHSYRATGSKNIKHATGLICLK